MPILLLYIFFFLCLYIKKLWYLLLAQTNLYEFTIRTHKFTKTPVETLVWHNKNLTLKKSKLNCQPRSESKIHHIDTVSFLNCTKKIYKKENISKITSVPKKTRTKTYICIRCNKRRTFGERKREIVLGYNTRVTYYP